MKHAHYDMIVAKAANMDLIVLTKDCLDAENPWMEIEVGHLPCFYEHGSYFLCLPKHKKAVLNFLNGGESECKIECDNEWGMPYRDEWNEMHWYMQEKFESRIKPEIQKLWIGIKEDHSTTNAYPTKHEARIEASRDHGLYSFVEVEVNTKTSKSETEATQEANEPTFKLFGSGYPGALWPAYIGEPISFDEVKDESGDVIGYSIEHRIR